MQGISDFQKKVNLDFVNTRSRMSESAKPKESRDHILWPDSMIYSRAVEVIDASSSEPFVFIVYGMTRDDLNISCEELHHKFGNVKTILHGQLSAHGRIVNSFSNS